MVRNPCKTQFRCHRHFEIGSRLGTCTTCTPPDVPAGIPTTVPQVYRALVAALGEEDDAAMQLAAVACLRALVDDW